MTSPWQRYIDVASSMTGTARKRAESAVRALVKQGEIASEKAEKTVDELLSRSSENRKAVASIAKTEAERAVNRLGLARQSEVDRLNKRIDELERELGGAKKSSAKKGSAKKASGKKASGKKASGKKSSAKKASGKKASAKKTSPPSSGDGGST